MVVEVTRMPIYTNALGSIPTQYFFNIFPHLFFFPFNFPDYVTCINFAVVNEEDLVESQIRDGRTADGECFSTLMFIMSHGREQEIATTVF